MSFTFTNYAALPSQASPFQDILGKVLKGYTDTTKARFLRPGLEEALKKAQLTNQYYPKLKDAELALSGQRLSSLKQLMGARAMKQELLKDNPLLAATNPDIQKIGYILDLKRHPEKYARGIPDVNAMPQPGGDQSFLPSVAPETPESKTQYLQQLLEQSLKPKNNQSLADYRQTMIARKHWDTLPADAKNNLIAAGQGAGIRADELEKELTGGKNLDEILLERGYDKDHPPEPIYLLTGKNRTDLNQREYASREVKYLSDYVNKATGDYAYRIRGYSPLQIRDALLGRNTHQQAEFLAARAISQELVNLRLLLAGARPTVHAQKALTDKSILDMKAFESTVTPAVWHEFQNIVDEKLQGAFKASKTGYGQPKIGAAKTGGQEDPLGIR